MKRSPYTVVKAPSSGWKILWQGRDIGEWYWLRSHAVRRIAELGSNPPPGAQA